MLATTRASGGLGKAGGSASQERHFPTNGSNCSQDRLTQALGLIRLAGGVALAASHANCLIPPNLPFSYTCRSAGEVVGGRGTGCRPGSS